MSGYCKECRFFEAPEREGEGLCKRYPPTVVSDVRKAYARFPYVAPLWWCGEFKRDDRN